MNKRRDSARLCFFFLSASLLNGSCSRAEKVEVINHFNQPVQVILSSETPKVRSFALGLP